ncbi:MAG: hypothetical protein AB7E39_03505 [Endomicrobiaceae bacterium]
MFRKALFINIFLILFHVLCYSEFPIGIYGVDNPEDIASVKQAGFNCIQTYKKDVETIRALAAEAKKYGIKLLVYPYNFIGSKYEKEAESYPLLAWYLYDEPDVWKMSREALIALNKKVKNTFRNHKTAFVIGEGATKRKYYDIADILLVDWYPVPHLPLESLGKNISYARQSLDSVGRYKTPVWAVIQMFDWKEYKQYRPDNKRIGRFPNKNEIRFMSYDAVFNGASGLFYFIYTSNGIPLPKSKPDKWKDISEIISEISYASEIFSKGDEIESIIKAEEPLKVKSYIYNGLVYVFILNSTSNFLKMPEALLESKVEALYECECCFKEGRYICPPYHVCVFKYKP